MNSAHLTYDRLCHMDTRELRAVLAQGTTPDPDALAGWEFRGYNVAPMSEVLRIRKFKKGFYRDEGTPEMLRGYNVKVKQNGYQNPWVPIMRDGEPVRHALFGVYPPRAGSRDAAHMNALLIDYSQGQHAPWDPSRVLRDYLVQVAPENPDLYLGTAYLALGMLRVPAGFFVAERYNERL